MAQDIDREQAQWDREQVDDFNTRAGLMLEKQDYQRRMAGDPEALRRVIENLQSIATLVCESGDKEAVSEAKSELRRDVNEQLREAAIGFVHFGLTEEGVATAMLISNRTDALEAADAVMKAAKLDDAGERWAMLARHMPAYPLRPVARRPETENNI